MQMTPRPSNSKWLTIGDAAKYLGISRDTLRRWEKRGRIKPTRSPTNRRFYTKEILDNAMSGKGDLGKRSKALRSKIKKLEIQLTIPNQLKLVIIGTLGFAVAALLAFFIQSLLLK
jgi:excisionase family DNA binding protein